MHWTVVFELYMERLIPQKDKCYKAIGLCALNIITMLGSVVNTIVGAYVIALRERISK